MNDKKHSASIEIYLTEYSSKVLNSQFDLENKLSNNQNIQFSLSKNKGSLNEFLCQSIGYDSIDLPWNQLRASQFNLGTQFDDVVKQHTLVCCDPVMMQVTHRGAYLWGQDSLNLSTEDVIAIVAQVNELLMEDGESFYLLNNKQWLYVNEKNIELNQVSFESEIGRDQFGFSYQGKDRAFWNRLATEIQMLIKQMIDYQGLTSVPEESLINVHFWGDSNHQLNSDIRVNQKSGMRIYTNDDLIKVFCDKANIKNEKLVNINNLIESVDTNIIINSSKSGRWLEELLGDLSSLVFTKNNKIKKLKIILQDKTIEITPRRSFFQRLYKLGF
ncbi:MAG: hypothetical protein COA86_12695 [Kangiella sp.]|nr:MAG: hypothetical protein COA86_12695 [Kangiella sp.]